VNRIARLLRARPKTNVEVPAQAPAAAETPPPVSYYELALRDDRMSGWGNEATGELCPGFRIGPNDLVVDAGCGDGGYAHFCAKQGARVIVSDVDAGALERATARLNTIQPPASFEARLTDGARLPIDDGVASRVICTEVIEHVDDPAQLMAELARIGRPGAVYLLACPAPEGEAIFKRIAPASCFERPNHIRILGPDEFASYVEASGLVIEQRVNRGFYWLMWWIMFWGCPELTGDMRHPLLDHWANTWSLLLDQKNGPMVKHALDDLLPKSQVIIARKPEA
jgi:SAM-dependent methyltransferase